MPIPKFDELMLPLMQFLQDGKEHSLKDSIAYVESHSNISEAERNQLLPSGRQRVIVNRVGWASSFLKKAEYIQRPHRGFMQITKRGAEHLAKSPNALTVEDLKRFPEFQANWDLGREDRQEESQSVLQDQTPEERIEGAFEEIEEDLAKNILEQIGSLSPAFFERLVVDLLLKMGYGGSFKDAGRAIGKSGDGGIDGIIKEDRLGLDTIYIQAKRYKEESTIGSGDVRDFIGALAIHHAKKGIFITTSSFSNDAYKSAVALDTKIVLIDGKRLAELMIEHGVGVSSQATYTVKSIDADYFSEE